MKIERVDCDSLTFDPHNVREHDERNVEAIKASLRRFGQQKPIVVDAEGVVVAGNGTLGAARLLGWKKIAVVQTKLSGAAAVAYAIADNRTADLAEWDGAELRSLVKELAAAGAANGLGFSEAELAAMTMTDDDLDDILGLNDDEPKRADPVLVVDFTEEQHEDALRCGKMIKNQEGDPAEVALHAVLRAADAS